MAFTQQNIIYEYGFDTKWELDKLIFTETNKIISEPKVVEGMPDVKWYLECVPVCTNLFGWPFTFFFHIESKNEIKYQIEAQIGNLKCNTIEKSSNGNLRNELARISNEDIYNPSKGYFKNNKVTVNVRGRFSFVHQSTNSKIIRDAAKCGLQLKEAFPHDFTITVGEKEIKITKPFLSTESSVFARMFESNFKEAQENRVSIPEFKFEIVQAAVDYCYAQNISAFLDKNDNENIIQLLYFCNKYDFKTLKPKLEELLASKISVSNVAKFAAVGDKGNSPKLRQTCVNFVRSLFNTQPSWKGTKLSDFFFFFFFFIFLSRLSDATHFPCGNAIIQLDMFTLGSLQ